MKLILTIIFLLFSASVVCSQNHNFICSRIAGKKLDPVSFNPHSTTLTFNANTKDELLKFLRSSFFIDTDKSQKTFEALVQDSATRANKQLLDLIELVNAAQPDGRVKISFLPPKSNFTAVIMCGGQKADTIPFSLNATAENLDGNNPVSGAEDKGLPYAQIIFISADMVTSVQNSSACNLCDNRNVSLKDIPLDGRKGRKFSTDYIVTFDPMLKNDDAYTICKHIFRPIIGKATKERYRKVGAKWFAPAVGSQIRFEVVNQPLTESRRITVDAIDVFNNGSTQFQGIINSQVNAQIINRLSQTTSSPAVADTGGVENVLGDDEAVRQPTDEEKLQMLHSQLVDYVSVFRLSACTIEEHMRNLPRIVSAVNGAFGTNANGVFALTQQMRSKFADSLDLKNIVDEIGSLFNLLKDLKPLAFTTIRAKNRDYLLVKTFDGNNAEISSENIRLSGGMKIDYSAGFVLTGLRDFTYKLKNATVMYNPLDNPSATRDTTGNVIIKEDEGKNNVGVGILTHFYPRLSSHYNIGGTVGLMTSTNLNLRLMLGGSFMVSSLFGSNNRVSFSYGRVWGKVARLSTEHDDFFNKPRVVNKVPQFYSQAAAPSPIQRNEGSWFFAITMNFGGN